MALISAFLLYFTVSLHPVWWVAWIAPLPLLYAAFQTTRREAGWLAFGAAALAYCSNAHYYWLTGGPNYVVAAVVIVLQAFAWSAVVRLAHRVVVTRERRWYAVFAYPVAWAALDTLVTFFSPHSSFGSLAYSQGDFLPVLQVTSIAGLPGVVFLLGIPASVIAVMLQYRLSWRMWVPAVAMLVVSLSWGAWRVSQGDSRTLGKVRVGLASVDDFVSGRVPQAAADRVWERYVQLVSDLAGQGANLILLPEKIEDFKTPERATEKMAMLAAAASKNGVSVAAGMSVPEGERMYNRLMVFGAHPPLHYDKLHLVPGLESYLTAGHRTQVATIGNAVYGLGVCKDFHFPSFGRLYAERRVDAVLDPAWDFDQDAWMAARLSAVRGIESGFAMLRSSRDGLLTVTDRFGRIAGETRSKPGAGASLVVDVDLAPGTPTLYGRFGDVFGWLMVMAAVALRLFPASS